MIRTERPPNFDAILKVFPLADKPGVVFAYGEDIYNPSGVKLPPEIVVHEYKHCARQFAYENGVKTWWDQYLLNPKFRYEEELLAHVEELKQALRGVRDRNAQFKLFDRTARRLIAPLYNYGSQYTLRNALHDIGRFF